MLLDRLRETHRQPGECIIRLGMGEQEIRDLYPVLKEVVVECSRQKASVATLTFEARRDESGRWLVQDDARIATWQPVLIEAAFGRHTEKVLRGFVRQVRAQYPENPGSAVVSVECQDVSLKLDRQHVRKTWGADVPTSDTAILSEILVNRHRLVTHPGPGRGQLGLVVNQDSTDIRFLQKRAQANSYELIFYPDTVYFGPMRVGVQAQSTILVYAGTDTHCIQFSVDADAHQPDAVGFDVLDDAGKVAPRRVVKPNLDRMGKESADSESSGLGNFVWLMARHGTGNEQELVIQAQQRANEAAMKIKATGQLDGSRYGHVLRVGEPVGVDGVGQRLAGTYYVDTVMHRFNTSGYQQDFTLLRNAYGDNLGSSLPGPLGRIAGAV